MRIRLGLIGNAIAKSRAPALHRFLGKLHGFELTYELFDPMSNQNDRFIAQLQTLRDEDYHGCNITYPFKQIAMHSVQHCEASARLVGATNTLKFSSGTYAINTDYSGFVRAISSKLDKHEI
ncbi:MAG: shikimate dehydrogenase, partial [Gammaproteobacteria bacterium]